MKKVIISVLFTFFFVNFSHSQGCLPDGILFQNQSQIDNFKSDYPVCDTIIGSIGIMGEDVYNLDSLSQIKYVQGYISIQQCPNLSNLNGLRNMEGIGDSFYIEYCNSLSDLLGLEELKSVGGDFMLWDNYHIKNLIGLGNLKEVGGKFVIHWMDGLYSLEGINKLTSISQGLVIWKNDSLSSLNGLRNVDSVGNEIYIRSNPRIKSLNGLNNLCLLGGTISIEMNDSLIDIMAIRNLNESVLDSVKIKKNHSLSECNIQLLCEMINVDPEKLIVADNSIGCSSIDEILQNCNDQGCLMEGINFTNQIQIDSFPILYPECSIIEGSVNIWGDNISDLSGLSNIKEIHGDLDILYCDSLMSLEGLNGLYEIGGGLGIQHNALLQNVDAFKSVDYIGGRVRFYYNLELVSIRGFEGLNQINGLEISSCSNLSDFSGLRNVERINGDFSFAFNPKMKGFEYFENLKEISGEFGVNSCGGLITIDGLNNIKILSDGLVITNCDSLQNLTGLESLKNVGVYCRIKNCKSLKNLDGLGELIKVDYLRLKNLSSIKNLHGLNNDIQINGYLEIEENDSLLSFEGLGYLDSLNGTLRVLYNPNLESFSDLQNLKSISDGIYIRGNDIITDLRGLEGVTDFKGGIGVVGNAKLQSLEGIGNLNVDSITRFEITENPNLYLCSINSICQLVNSLPDDIYFNISDNTLGCNNIEEVQELCLINPELEYSFPLFSVQPTWNVLDKQLNEIETFSTMDLEYDYDTVLCNYIYSRISLNGLGVFVRQNDLQVYYRKGDNCSSKEYLLYDYSLNIGDTTYVGWDQYDWYGSDTAAFVVEQIEEMEQFGVLRNRFTLVYAGSDGAYSGQLHWLEGVGCEEHPFYPFARMDDYQMNEYELLCLDSIGHQLYQSPNWTVCDTNYTSIGDLESSGFEVSPNPFINRIYIASNNKEIKGIQLLTLTGQFIPISWSNNGRIANVRIPEESPNGIYILRIVTVDGYRNLKVMKVDRSLK